MHSSQTITSLYSAILDDALWPTALDALAREFGAQSSLLIHSDVNDKLPFRIQRASQLWNELDGETVSHYENELGHYEAAACKFLQRSPIGTIAVDTDFLKAKLLRARPDYQYTIKHLDLCHRASMRLNGNNTWFEALTIHFAPKFQSVPNSSRSLLTGILPHVAKARECSCLFRALRSRYLTALNALDHVDIGLCIVDSTAEIILKNAKADEIIANNTSVIVRADRVLEIVGKNALLLEAIKRCSKSAAGEDSTTEVLLVAADRFNGCELLLEVSPFRDSAGELENGLEGAMVTLIDPSKTDMLDSARVAQLCKLTKAETTVLKLLLLGNTNREIAEERNVSVETVKSQVNCVYTKTRTRRRSDLIRLVARTSPPVH